MKRVIEPFRNEIWTYVIVTALTLLIWFWAAGETREETTIYPTLRFEPPASGKWTVTPQELTVTLRVEGSRRATQLASNATARRLVIPLPPPGDSGTVEVDLLRELRQQALLRQTGVSVVSVEPAFVEPQVDEIIPVKALVSVKLPPGVQTDGEILVEPREVTINMPRRLKPVNDNSLEVDAIVGPTANVETLEPGIAHTLPDLPVRLPEALRGAPGVSVAPTTVNITFTVRSRIRQVTLPDVRVQVSSDPKNFLEYAVEVVEADNVLRDVTISAESDLARKIEDGSAKVAAIVQLTTRDLEEHIESKPVTYFRAIVSENGEPDRGIIVDAKVGDDVEAPVVHLRIKKREAPET